MENNETPTSSGLSKALVGTWKLLSREDYSAKGDRRIDPGLGADPVAILFFDGKGNFGAQFMKRNRESAREPEPAILAPNNSRARGGYDAYFGTYTVDEATGTVTTRLEGALSQENVGQVYQRRMRIEGGALVIVLDTATPEGEPIVRTLRWRREA